MPLYNPADGVEEFIPNSLAPAYPAQYGTKVAGDDTVGTAAKLSSAKETCAAPPMCADIDPIARFPGGGAEDRVLENHVQMASAARGSALAPRGLDAIAAWFRSLYQEPTGYFGATVSHLLATVMKPDGDDETLEQQQIGR